MATLKDVAQEAGLSVTTVSRILNNRGYISSEARQKVSDAMQRLNYQPNEVARSLSLRRSNMVALIVPHIRHPYFAALVSELEEAIRRRGYQILLFNTK
jgi:LacI family sucrose operon transcriptional repressor